MAHPRSSAVVPLIALATEKSPLKVWEKVAVAFWSATLPTSEDAPSVLDALSIVATATKQQASFKDFV
jgi:hypothetical protein